MHTLGLPTLLQDRLLRSRPSLIEQMMCFYMKLNTAVNLLPVFDCHHHQHWPSRFRTVHHPALCSTRLTPSLDSEEQ